MEAGGRRARAIQGRQQSYQQTRRHSRWQETKTDDEEGMMERENRRDDHITNAVNGEGKRGREECAKDSKTMQLEEDRHVALLLLLNFAGLLFPLPLPLLCLLDFLSLQGIKHCFSRRCLDGLGAGKPHG